MVIRVFTSSLYCGYVCSSARLTAAIAEPKTAQSLFGMATFFNIVRDHCGDAPGNQIEGTGHGDYEHCVKVEITHSRNLPTPRPAGKCFWRLKIRQLCPVFRRFALRAAP
jgi:hypothetical protein